MIVKCLDFVGATLSYSTLSHQQELLLVAICTRGMHPQLVEIASLPYSRSRSSKNLRRTAYSKKSTKIWEIWEI